MEQSTPNNGIIKKSIDFEYIFRQIKKKIYTISCIAIILGVFVYIWQDKHIESSYKATMVLVVVPRDNVANRQLSSAIEMAATRSVNVLNSSSLRDQIVAENNGVALPGSIVAEIIPDTNMIRMVATSSNSRDSLKLLRAGINAYPAIAGYMESGYLLRTLSEVSADNIVCEESRASYIAFLVIAGLMLAGLAIVVILAMFTDKIHDRRQVEELLDLSLLGTLTFVKKKHRKKAILTNEDDVDIAYIENIDRIATTLQQTMEEEGCKTLSVTSINENDGKTTVIANLAINLASRGYKVCLIDADMRRPAIGKLLDRTEDIKVSLNQVLEGEKTIKEAMLTYDNGIEMYIQKEGIAEPDKLLEAESFKSFLDKLETEADYILIDTPPLGMLRDAEIVAKNVDRVALVFCQDQTHAVDINDATALLENAGTTVIGGIMNKTRRPILSTSNDSYGSYYYYYGYSRKKSKRRV